MMLGFKGVSFLIDRKDVPRFRRAEVHLQTSYVLSLLRSNHEKNQIKSLEITKKKALYKKREKKQGRVGQRCVLFE